MVLALAGDSTITSDLPCTLAPFDAAGASSSSGSATTLARALASALAAGFFATALALAAFGGATFRAGRVALDAADFFLDAICRLCRASAPAEVSMRWAGNRL